MIPDEGIICPKCDGPTALDHANEYREYYLCLTCGAWVLVSFADVHRLMKEASGA